LIHELGIGGMGAVYLACETASMRKVAIKFLQRPGHQGAFERFGVEVKTLGTLDHPNIIRYFASDFLRSTPYFTSEYAAGGCLLKKLETKGAFEPREAARIMAIVARAIHAAHSANIIHRDLKPSNIVLTAEGLPKVSDFGLAKRLDQNDDLTTGTGPLGSPPYMAPEQTGRDEGKIDSRTDVYGLGATLYHLVTGRRPFLGSQDEVIRQVKNDFPAPPRSVRREIPRELEAIILKCLEKNPAKRYQSAEALADDLDNFLIGDKAIVAPILTGSRRARLWVQRNPKRVLGAGLGAIAMMVLAWVWLTPANDAIADYHRLLRTGKPVSLIEAKGLPRWFDRPIGNVELGTDIAAEGACTISAIGHGTVVLLPSIKNEHYSVEAEIREMDFRGAIPDREDHQQWYGLAVGYQMSPLPENGRLHSFFAITFRDFARVAADGQVIPEVAKLHAPVIAERPGRNPESISGNAKYRISFVPSPRLPGKWRKVRLLIAPDRIQAFWREDSPDTDGPEKMTKFADLGPAEIAERIAMTQGNLNRQNPKMPVNIPPWSTQGGIAIWCYKSSIAVRNVIVSPLPDAAP
jgi:hypothetical protein